MVLLRPRTDGFMSWPRRAGNILEYSQQSEADTRCRQTQQGFLFAFSEKRRLWGKTFGARWRLYVASLPEEEEGMRTWHRIHEQPLLLSGESRCEPLYSPFLTEYDRLDSYLATVVIEVTSGRRKGNPGRLRGGCWVTDTRPFLLVREWRGIGITFEESGASQGFTGRIYHNGTDEMEVGWKSKATTNVAHLTACS